MNKKRFKTGDLVEVTTSQYAGAGIGPKAIVVDTYGAEEVHADDQILVAFITGMYQGETQHRAGRYVWEVKG